MPSIQLQRLAAEAAGLVAGVDAQGHIENHHGRRKPQHLGVNGDWKRGFDPRQPTEHLAQRNQHQTHARKAQKSAEHQGARHLGPTVAPDLTAHLPLGRGHRDQAEHRAKAVYQGVQRLGQEGQRLVGPPPNGFYRQQQQGSPQGRQQQAIANTALVLALVHRQTGFYWTKGLDVWVWMSGLNGTAREDGGGDLSSLIGDR